MFSERDDKAVQQQFQEIIFHDISYDPAYYRTNHLMARAERELNDGVDDGTSDALEELWDSWALPVAPTEVSGQVYAVDDVLAVVPPRENWGDCSVDAYGSWFNMQNVELVCIGLATIGGEDPELATRVGYGFVLPATYIDSVENDITCAPEFIALPSTSSINFLKPSDEAIDKRLHDAYPDLMDEIDQVVSTHSTNLNKKIKALREIMPKYRIDDNDGSSDGIGDGSASMLAEYLSRYLQIDDALPYVVTMRDSVSLLDVDGTMEEINLSDLTSQCAYIQGVRIDQLDGEGSGINASLTLSMPSSRKHIDHEPAELFVPFDSIEGIQSLRPKKSFAEQVAQNRIAKASRLAVNDTFMSLFSASPESALERTVSDEMHAEPVDDLVRLERLNENTQAMILAVVEATRSRYRDHEQAVRASTDLCTRINARINELGLNGQLLTVRAHNVLWSEETVHFDDEKFSLTTNPSQVKTNGNNMYDEHTGNLQDFYCRIGSAKDTDSQDDVYYLKPYIALKKHSSVINPYPHLTLPLANIYINSLTFAPINDDGVEVELREYVDSVRLRQSLNALGELGDNGLQLQHELTAIRDASIAGRDATNFVEFPMLAELKSAGALVTKFDMDERAVEAVDRLFLPKQTLMIGGKEVTEQGTRAVMMTGEFVAIVPHHPYGDGQQLTIILQDSNDIMYYFPLASIEALRY